MPVSREALLSYNQLRLNQGPEGVLDRASATHTDAIGQVRVAEQPVVMPSNEEHHGETQLLTEDGLRQPSHRVVHSYLRHISTILGMSLTRYGNLVT